MNQPNSGSERSRLSSADEGNIVLLNRHPIHDSKLVAVGYQPTAYSRVIGKGPGDENGPANSAAVLRLLAENFDTLTGKSWGLLSLPWQSIVAGDYEMLPRDRVVINIDDGPPDEQFFKSVARLSTRGYRLALPITNSNLVSIAGLADILKLNLSEVGSQNYTPGVGRIQTRKAKMLITGIETYDDFECWRDLGFDLFEGYFFCTPKKRKAVVAPTRLAAIRLLVALQDPEVRAKELEDIIRYDVSLSYRLLRFVNSAAVGLHREVLSIKHAVNMVGFESLRKWASILLFAGVENTPSSLVITAAVRARMCEQLAEPQDESRRATFFLTGLLSVLDALFDIPMAEAVQGLPLSKEITEALVHGSGRLGTTLRAVIAYEQGDWQRHALLRFRPSTLQHSYLDSLRWTEGIVSNIVI